MVLILSLVTRDGASLKYERLKTSIREESAIGTKASGSQRRSGRPSAAPSGKRRTRTYAVIVLVVAVVALAITAAALSTPTQSSNGGSTTTSVWQPLQGHYLDFILKTNGTTYGTERMLVIAVGTTITLNITIDANGTETKQNQDVYPGQAVGPGFDLESPPWTHTVTNEGKVSVMTAFGSRSCDHYHVSVLNEGHGNVTMDYYIYKGLMVKMDGDDGTSTFSMFLSGTNIPVTINS